MAFLKHWQTKIAVCITVLVVLSMSSVIRMVPVGLGVELGQVEVSVDLGKVIGVNNFSLGFQLDGRDIRQWRDRSVLRGLAQDADFKLVRFFEHRLGKPCLYWNEDTKTGTWDWTNVDLLVQRIFEIGAEPLIVLGFYSWEYDRITSAPRGMFNDPKTGLPYPDQWGAYCSEWVRHFKNVGLPVKYYEIINEPFHYFGSGYADRTKIGYYMELYNAAAIAMRAENLQVQIGCDSSTSKRVLDHFVSHGEDLDFISFHRYGTGSKSESDEEILSAAETKYIENSWDRYGVDTARQVYKNARGVDLPVIMSEGNVNYAYIRGTDPRTRQMLGAVYTALSIRIFILKNLIYGVYFTFGSSGTEGIGMVNVDDNKPWYPYYAQQMIGKNLAVGDKLVETASSSEDVYGLAWLHDGKLMILLVCKIDNPRTVNLDGVTGQLNCFKIDNTISWKTPSVQTDTMDSADVITMNGYTVMVLQSGGFNAFSI